MKIIQEHLELIETYLKFFSKEIMFFFFKNQITTKNIFANIKFIILENILQILTKQNTYNHPSWSIPKTSFAKKNSQKPKNDQLDLPPTPSNSHK